MVYRPKIDQKLCFVIMPFGSPFDDYYEKIIKPAASELGMDALRSDEIRGRKAIIRDIWEHIWAARIVVADVTTKNANVNYELGLCDALGVPTVIIAATIDDAPFDYQHRRIIVYKRDRVGWDDQLKKEICETISAVLREGEVKEELEWPYDTNDLREPASSSILIASEDSREIVIRGAELVRDAIASAYGPRGTSVSLSQPFGIAKQVYRGSQIASGIKSSNPLEEKGIEQIRLAAATAQNRCGDASKLAAILCATLMRKGQEVLDKGFHPRDLVLALEAAVRKASKVLRDIARDVDMGKLQFVASTASRDKRVGTMLVQAMKKVGKHGIIAVAESSRSETYLEISEGVQFDGGYVSDYFVTNPQTGECTLEDCSVLLYRGRIQSMRDLLPVLETIAAANRSILVVADEVEGEALNTLAFNAIKGKLRCCAVRAPAAGDRRRAVMEDLGVITGGTVVSAEFGLSLLNLRFEHLGKAEKVTCTQDSTTIVGGAGSEDAKQDRIRQLERKLLSSPNDFDKEKLQERIAWLAGGVAVIKLGGASEADILYEKYKCESALHSAYSAVEEGSITGGAVSLLRTAAQLRRLSPSDDELENHARYAVASALEEPIRQLIANSKRSPTQVIAQILDSTSPDVGFNAETYVVEDLAQRGILDPLKSADLALAIALSVASTVLQTGTWDLNPPPSREGGLPRD